MVRPSSVDEPTKVQLDGDGPRVGADEALTIATDFEQRYQLGLELARGGLARIRDAYDRVLHRRVAVKQLLTRDGDADLRFLREARITGRLAHPNIVPIYDLGLDGDGAPFYAMKWVEGRSLHDLIDDRASLDDRLALLPHVQAIADAIAYAHAVGVIHRDLKPANVLVGDFGETIVIDWGLALEAGIDDLAPTWNDGPGPARSPRLTSVGSVIGTPAYMPPEQARGDRVDERADVYALGATLYHVIAGEFPYAHVGATPDVDEPVWVRVLDRPPLALATLCPEAPPELCAIVERAMARTPEARHGSAAELGVAIASFVAHHQSHRLSAAAVRRDAELSARMREVRTDDAAAVAAVYREADVVQFGFEQALAAWPDNPIARGGLTRLQARLFDFECALGNLAAAAALAEALPPDADRARMLAALRDDLARRDAEAAAFTHASDRSIGGRERTILLGVVGAMLVYFLVDSLAGQRSLDDPRANTRLLHNAIAVAVAALIMMWRWRRRMFGNEFAERAGRTVAALMVATVTHRALAVVIQQPARDLFVLDQLLLTVGMWIFGGKSGMTLGTIALAGAWVVAMIPATAILVYNGTLIGFTAVLAVTWSRAAR